MSSEQVFLVSIWHCILNERYVLHYHFMRNLYQLDYEVFFHHMGPIHY